MKIQRPITSALTALSAAAGLFAAASGFGQTAPYVIDFPQSSTSGAWQWWGESPYQFVTNDVNNGSTSGSLYIANTLSGGTLWSKAGGDNQWCVAYDLNGTNGGGSYNSGVSLDLTLYTNVQVSFKYDAANSDFPLHDLNTNGGDAGLIFGVTGNAEGWDQNWLGAAALPDASSNAWVTLNYPVTAISLGHSGATAINAVIFKKYSGAGIYNDTNEVSLTNSRMAFFVDHVVFQPSSKPLPPPSVGLQNTTPGLNLFNGATSIYQRESLRATNSNFSWFNVGHPVSYSYTITSYPQGVGRSGFQNHIFLVPGAGTVTETGPDWNEANIVMLDLENATNGGMQWNFRYKTNEANANSFMYGAGTIATLNCSTAVGTWTCTFNNNTNVTLTDPLGDFTNFNIPDDASFSTASLFANPLELYFGVQAGSTTMLGQVATFGSFTVTGAASSFTDNFLADSVINTNLWTVDANDSTSVQLVNAAQPYWVTMTTPNAGYSVIYSPTLQHPLSWTSPSGIVGYGNIGTKSYSLVPSSVLSGNQGYFEAIKRTFTQLVVVLPGQTLTPGVSPGVSGTPTAVSLGAGGAEDVTVYALDAQFYPVQGISDSINLSCTDPLSTVPAAPVLMANGVATFTGANDVLFGTQSPPTWTITATDASDATKTANTSSPVTVTP